MGRAEVSDILWQELRLLELLVFKLEEEQLLLASGRSRWLNHATREIDIVLDQIKAVGLTRAIEVAQLGNDLGLGHDPSLRDLAEAVEGPWRAIYAQHRRGFLAAADETQALAQVNRELLSRAQQATQEAQAWLMPGAADSNGAFQTGLCNVENIDWSETIADFQLQLNAYQAAWAAAAKTIQPSLVDFLK